jgi:hypothetical protein
VSIRTLTYAQSASGRQPCRSQSLIRCRLVDGHRVPANARNDAHVRTTTTTTPPTVTTTTPADDVPTAVIATNTQDASAALAVVLRAVKTLLRFERDIELPAHGIDLAYDAGVVATCRRCHLSWRVSRRNFSAPSWWSCPTGCRHPSIATEILPVA